VARPGTTADDAPRVTIVALLAIGLADLAYLVVESFEPSDLAPSLLVGRLFLAGLMVAPAGYLLAGGRLLRLRRHGPLIGLLAAASFCLVASGQRPPLAAAYLGFFPAIPLLYALAFPEEPRGATLAGLALAACGTVLARSHGSTLLNVELIGTIVCTTAVAAYGGAAYRRIRTREAAAVDQRTDALDALARSERERAKAERLAAVGVLADGVAHEVNSPLASLRSNIHVASEDLLAGRLSEAREALQDADECASRINAIVTNLRAASRPRLIGPEERGEE